MWPSASGPNTTSTLPLTPISVAVVVVLADRTTQADETAACDPAQPDPNCTRQAGSVPRLRDRRGGAPHPSTAPHKRYRGTSGTYSASSHVDAAAAGPHQAAGYVPPAAGRKRPPGAWARGGGGSPSAANGAQMERPVRPERRCHQRYKPNYGHICSSCRLLS